MDDASAFSDATPGWVLEVKESPRCRVRKSRQKEAAGAADAGVMEIEWSEEGCRSWREWSRLVEEGLAQLVQRRFDG
jgi:hypothetical protein